MAAQSKFSFMLVLCSRQIPAKANKLILSYLILIKNYKHANCLVGRFRENFMPRIIASPIARYLNDLRSSRRFAF